jgi:hypothetical protein
MGYFAVRVWLVVLLLGAAAPSWARQQNGNGGEPESAATTDPVPEPAPLDPDALPVNVNKIQRRLSRPPAIRPETTRPVIRVQVFGRNPTIDEILGPEWRKGPTPLGAMTHQEFLDIVTPQAVRGYAAFDNGQGAVVAATSFALQWAVSRALKKLEDARTSRQKEAAEQEVREALAALRKARREAGLPER